MAVYFIDGYNVIHHSSLLRPLVGHGMEIARDALIGKVEAFCGSTGEGATLFFDGHGDHAAQAASYKHVPGFEIVYSHGGLSADAMIERMVYQAKNRADIVVVSADMGIRQLCRGLGAFVMSSENFLARTNEARGEVGQTLKAKHQDNSTPRIEDRLDQDSLEMLSELKKRLSGD